MIPPPSMRSRFLHIALQRWGRDKAEMPRRSLLVDVESCKNNTVAASQTLKKVNNSLVSNNIK